MPFVWEQRVRLFRDTNTGQFVAHRTIRKGVDQVVDVASRDMVMLSQRLREGTISLQDWERDMRRVVKLNELAQTMAAHGGRNAMRLDDYLAAARNIKAQYRYLQKFTEEIASGQQPLNGRFIARAALYGQHARTTYENTRLHDAGESDTPMLVRNVLHAREHCAGCVAATALGFVPLAQMPLLGSRDCLANDRCTLAYRPSKNLAQVAS